MGHQIAKDIVAYCTSCRMNLVHLIVAMESDKVVRVLCKTCKREHAYRAPKGMLESMGKKTKLNATAKKKMEGPGDWELAMEQYNDQPAKLYTLAGIFMEGDKIDHSRFGMGFVRQLIKPNKMEVLFEEEIKIMVRGAAGPQS